MNQFTQMPALDLCMKWAPRTTEVILLLFLLGVMASWFDFEKPLATSVPLSENQPGINQEAMDQIMAIQLFGDPDAEPAPKNNVLPEPVRLSPLGVNLLGTVVAGDGSAAILVAQGSGEQRVVMLGHFISPGIKLIGVETGSIVIERSGMQERILMEKGALLDHTPITNGQPQVQTSAQAMSLSAGNKSDLARLMSDIRLLPHYTENRQDGLQVAALVPGSIWQRSGLINGDLIESVNEIPVSGIQQIVKISQSLHPGDSVRLALRRNGQLQNVQIVLPQ